MRFVVFVWLVACSSKPAASVPYRQDFAATLGPEWHSTSKGWRVADGALQNDGARNVPLWLSLALPDDVRISMTAKSQSPAVDMKFEVFGDGENHASGYIVILGGWKNTKSIIARLDEHGPERSSDEDERLRATGLDPSFAGNRDQTLRTDKALPNHAYRLRFERKGGELSFYVDDALYLRFFDPAPLKGSGHDRFAFNNWASRVTFDDLVIEPL